MNMARTKQLSNMHPRSQEHMWLYICRNQAAWALLKAAHTPVIRKLEVHDLVGCFLQRDVHREHQI